MERSIYITTNHVVTQNSSINCHSKGIIPLNDRKSVNDEMQFIEKVKVGTRRAHLGELHCCR